MTDATSPPARARRGTDPAVEATIDELLALVIDDLVPAVGWYRSQVARHLEIGIPGLGCLELVRRRPRSAAQLGSRTGLTPSAMNRVVRRLEAEGHVERTASRTHEQQLIIGLRAHEHRDVVLELVRQHVRGAIEHLVSSFGLAEDARRAAAANVLVHVSAALGQEAWEMEQAAARTAYASRRERERERTGRRPIWDW
jgi:DNA-binding MarR family transcriptional regulator